MRLELGLALGFGGRALGFRRRVSVTWGEEDAAATVL